MIGTEFEVYKRAVDAVKAYQAEMLVDDEGNELVQPQSCCGFCGERRMDWLEWVDDTHVRCTTCGTVYTPESEEA